MSFAEGDILINVTEAGDGWVTGTVESTGASGMLPSNYIQPAGGDAAPQAAAEPEPELEVEPEPEPEAEAGEEPEPEPEAGAGEVYLAQFDYEATDEDEVRSAGLSPSQGLVAC